MHLVTKKQSRHAYLPWLQQLQDYGEPVEVRGHKTLEFLNCVTEIQEPQHHCILMPSRRWNPFLALSEALWILAGRDDVAALEPYNSHIKDYSDDGSTLYGAYGARIYSQIDPLIERLRKDPSDRRAVLQIWDDAGSPNYVVDLPKNTGGFHSDLTYSGLDAPCNNMVYFKLRDNKLHMTVINRSNDLHFGLMAVNLPTFGILQSYIAARLGVEMGIQTHFSNSLHIYTDDKRAARITDRMLYQYSEDMPVYPRHWPAFYPSEFELPFKNTHERLASLCNDALDNKPLPSGTHEFICFGKEFLRAYRERDLTIVDGFKDYYLDWILAGDLFISKVWK